MQLKIGFWLPDLITIILSKMSKTECKGRICGKFEEIPFTKINYLRLSRSSKQSTFSCTSQHIHHKICRGLQNQDHWEVVQTPANNSDWKQRSHHIMGYDSAQTCHCHYGQERKSLFCWSNSSVWEKLALQNSQRSNPSTKIRKSKSIGCGIWRWK